MSLTRLICTEEGCDFRCPVDPVEMGKHTTVAHFRGPTVDERTPQLIADRRAVDVVWRDGVTGLEFVRQLDHTGRPWALVVDDFGFTRVDGVWRQGYIGSDIGEYGRKARRPHRLTGSYRPALRSHPTPMVLAALDRWEIAMLPADSDPTPARGIARPFIALVGAR